MLTLIKWWYLAGRCVVHLTSSIVKVVGVSVYRWFRYRNHWHLIRIECSTAAKYNNNKLLEVASTSQCSMFYYGDNGLSVHSHICTVCKCIANEHAFTCFRRHFDSDNDHSFIILVVTCNDKTFILFVDGWTNVPWTHGHKPTLQRGNLSKSQTCHPEWLRGVGVFVQGEHKK